MKPRLVFALLLVVSASAPLSRGQAIADPARRQASLNQAAELLAAKPNPSSTLPDDLVDPFNPSYLSGPAKSAGGPAAPASAGSDREILERIMDNIRPSGTLVLGGQPYLLFREKRLKVGDTLTIAFEGADHTLVITGIDRTSFKLRLNNEEITRPIK